MKVIIEIMTVEEYKNLFIDYGFYSTPFKKDVLIASTLKGICYIGFSDDRKSAVLQLSKRFPLAVLNNKETELHYKALKYFSFYNGEYDVHLHIYGTPFQIEVWKALLGIPFGHLVSYGEIALKINRPKACRAVGAAIGNNPVSCLIPCHRVILSDGNIGNYFWGIGLKKSIIEWENHILVEYGNISTCIFDKFQNT